jgi:uncharacterized protein (DUF1778 family)
MSMAAVIRGRGRPLKKPELCKTDQMRIPVTPDFKERIRRAAALDGREITAWCRDAIECQLEWIEDEHGLKKAAPVA